MTHLGSLTVSEFLSRGLFRAMSFAVLFLVDFTV